MTLYGLLGGWDSSSQIPLRPHSHLQEMLDNTDLMVKDPGLESALGRMFSLEAAFTNSVEEYMALVEVVQHVPA